MTLFRAFVKPWYLALDQGGHASRALVISARGEVVASAYKEVSSQYFDGNKVEHDAEELVQSLRQCCDSIAQQLGSDISHIVSAGLVTQRSSVVCWRRDNGRALSPVLSWQDRRGQDFISERGSHKQEVKSISGLMLSPHYGASKLHWCLNHLDDVIDSCQQGNLRLGPLASFIARQLVQEGEADGYQDVCDPANASRTLLWEAQSGQWSPRLCQLFAVDEALLPRLVDSHYNFGTLRVGSNSIPLSFVGGDQSAALYALGWPKPDTAYINLGTGAFVQLPTGKEVVNPESLLCSVVRKQSGATEYVLEATVNGAGSALTWFAGQQELSLVTLLSDGERELLAGVQPPLFLNGISGLASPYWRSDFQSCFVGEGSAALRALGVLESIAFLIQSNIEELKKYRSVKEVILSGGLSNNQYLCGAIACLSGMEVFRSGEPEGTALGLGFLLSEGQDWCVDTTERVEPYRCDRGQLGDRYRAWRAALAQAL